MNVAKKVSPENGCFHSNSFSASWCASWNERENVVLAELRRAKHASGAPWVIKFGKPSIRENLVMT